MTNIKRYTVDPEHKNMLIPINKADKLSIDEKSILVAKELVDRKLSPIVYEDDYNIDPISSFTDYYRTGEWTSLTEMYIKEAYGVDIQNCIDRTDGLNSIIPEKVEKELDDQIIKLNINLKGVKK
jgi:hypothetical protein